MNGRGESDLILVAEHAWDPAADAPRGHTEVRIRGGRIEEVADSIAHGAAEVVELGERMLMPGLIDCHVHVTMDPSDLLGRFIARTPAQIALDALPVLSGYLDRGFTTVRDLATFTFPAATTALRDAVAAGTVVGPRMLVAPHMISARGAHGDLSPLLNPTLGEEIGVLADGPDEIARAVREEIRAGADWVKFGASGGFGSPTDDPGQATYSQQEMDALVAAARDLGVPVAPHAYGDEAVTRAVHAGVRSIEHGNLASAQTLQLMEDQGVFLVPTQMMALGAVQHLDDDDYWLGKDPAERRKFRRYADDLTASARNVAASGVKIAFGTDAGMFPHEQNWQEFLTMTENGISAVRALRAATITAAELLERPDLGRLRRGAVADLIAMPGNPFDDIAAVGDVDVVMQAGVFHRRP